MNKKKFDGSISEIMVAYKPNGDLDFEPVKKMVEFQVENHIDGLFMGGLSTQTYLLSMEEKKQVCAELMNAAAGRVPVRDGKTRRKHPALYLHISLPRDLEL